MLQRNFQGLGAAWHGCYNVTRENGKDPFEALKLLRLPHKSRGHIRPYPRVTFAEVGANATPCLSWSVPLDESNLFTILLILALDYPSEYPSRWLYFPPAGYGWQFSRERTRCSWNMSDNITCDHSHSDVVGGRFPTRTTPRSINLKHDQHGDIFFIGPKKFLDCQNPKNRTKVSKKETKSIEYGIFYCNHFGWQFRVHTKKCQTPIIWPY